MVSSSKTRKPILSPISQQLMSWIILTALLFLITFRSQQREAERDARREAWKVSYQTTKSAVDALAHDINKANLELDQLKKSGKVTRTDIQRFEAISKRNRKRLDQLSREVERLQAG